MKFEIVQEMIETRLEIAKKEQNTTEVSFLWELLKMSEELKGRKEREKNG